MISKDDLICPVSKSYIKNPVVGPDGIIYDKSSVPNMNTYPITLFDNIIKNINETGNNYSLTSNDITCSLTYEYYNIPVVTSDGQIYEEDIIFDWITIKKESKEKIINSPLTNMIIKTTLYPIILLRNKINEYFIQNPLEKNKQYKIDIKYNKELLLNFKNFNYNKQCECINIISKENKFNDFVFHILKNIKSLDLIKYLVENYPYILEYTGKDKLKNKPIHMICQYQDEECVKYIINKANDLEYENKGGWSPFLLILCNQNNNCIKLILEKNVNKNYKPQLFKNINEKIISKYQNYNLEEKQEFIDILITNELLTDSVSEMFKSSPLYIQLYIIKKYNMFKIEFNDKNKAEFEKLIIEKQYECINILSKQDNFNDFVFHILRNIKSLDIIKYLVENYSYILDYKDINENKPIHIICQCQNEECINYIINKTNDLDCENKDGWSPILLLLYSKDFNYIKSLINENKINLEIEIKNNVLKIINDRLVLLFKSLNNDNKLEFIDIFNNFIELIIEIINISSIKIILYILKNNKNIISYKNHYIIKFNTSVNFMDDFNKLNYDDQILIIQFYSNQLNFKELVSHIFEKSPINIIKYIVENYNHILDCENKDGWRPIHIVCQYRNYDCIKLLVDKGVNLECENNKWKPIHIVCRLQNYNCIKLLVDKNVNLECENNDNWKPIHLVCRYQNFDCIKLLVDKNVNLECETNYGWRPIQFVCQYQNEKCIDLFLEKNVDLEYTNIEGYKPIYYIFKRFNYKYIKKFYDKGVNMLSTKQNGKNILSFLHDNPHKNEILKKMFSNSD